MSSTTFVDHATPVVAAWLNDVNDTIYEVTQTGTDAVARTAASKMKDTVAPEDFGADPTGVEDSTDAINAALAAHDRVVGTGSYLATGNISIPRGGVTLQLDTLTITAPVKIPTGNDISFIVREFGVTNSFTTGTYMVELGVDGDTVRYDNLKIKFDLVNGKSPDTTTRAHVIRNYNRIFSDFEMRRVRDVKNVYVIDEPDCALGDNKIHGSIIENAEYGLYLHGTGANHCEHHVLDYNFVAGCANGAVYARDRAHYQVMIGAYDFNGQSLVKLTCANAPVISIGDTATGSSTGATGTVIAAEGVEILCIRLAGTFTTADSIEGEAVSTVLIYGSGSGEYLDFISQTQDSFARHRLDCPYLTNVFGNNQEDWVIISASGASNFRAKIAGQSFFASTTEQYTQVALPSYQLRYSAVNLLKFTATVAQVRNANDAAVVAADTNAWSCADGSGNALISWTTAAGYSIGEWGGTQPILIKKFMTFTTQTAASAPNNSLFRDVADNVLKFKDDGGVVNLLY